jgi:magnesium and cobalt transporter
MRLDEFAEYFNIDEDEIDDEDIDTIGGLVLKLLGRLAQINDLVKMKNLTFIVKEVDGARITKLEIIKEEICEEKVEENN